MTKKSAIAATLYLAFSLHALGQVRDKFDGWCDRLATETPAQLLNFLNSPTDDAQDTRCVTWAIHELGRSRYQPAVATLVRLLNFRRPQMKDQEMFEGIHREIFPAEEALELIGKPSLPEVLGAIGGSTSSDIRHNALRVWMEIYRENDEHVLGVANLKREETRAVDAIMKQRLKWATGKAVDMCDPSERSKCERAAETGTP
jgi:hypothetical protein